MIFCVSHYSIYEVCFFCHPFFVSSVISNWRHSLIWRLVQWKPKIITLWRTLQIAAWNNKMTRSQMQERFNLHSMCAWSHSLISVLLHPQSPQWIWWRWPLQQYQLTHAHMVASSHTHLHWTPTPSLEHTPTEQRCPNTMCCSWSPHHTAGGPVKINLARMETFLLKACLRVSHWAVDLCFFSSKNQRWYQLRSIGTQRCHHKWDIKSYEQTIATVKYSPIFITNLLPMGIYDP